MTPIASRRLVPQSPGQRLEELQPLIHAIRYYMPKVLTSLPSANPPFELDF